MDPGDAALLERAAGVSAPIVADKAAVIRTARSQLGYAESPSGSNRTKYGQWYGMDGVAWCAIFVSWCFWHSGNPLPRVTTAKGYAYVPEIVRYGQESGTWHSGLRDVAPGDILVWKFATGPNRPNHTSICGEKGLLPDGRVHSLDGNSNSGGSRTGGMVAELYRRTGAYGYVRVTPKNTTPAPPPQESDDMAAPKHIRLDSPGNPFHGRIELVGDFHRRWIPPEEWRLHIFLGGKAAQNVNLDGWNALTSNKQVILDGRGA